MKVAIYGAGEYGQYIYNEIINHKHAKINAIFWLDNFWRKRWQCCAVESELLGRPVYTEERFFIEHKYDEIDAVIIAIDNNKIAQDITVSLLLQGYESIYLALPDGFRPKVPVLNETGDFSSCIQFYKKIKPRLGEDEIVNFLVTDYCNLKCKRCANFSNITHEYNSLDVKEFEHYLIQLRKKFGSIFRIQLLGGEPLLNPELDVYILLVRKYFPETRIDVVTNGLLILRMKPEMVDAMVSCGAFFYISQYQPTRELLDKIIYFLEEKRINYNITEPIRQFEKPMTLKEENGNKAFVERYKRKDCLCHTIKEGRMGCTFVLNVYDHRDYFNLPIGEEDLKASTIDVMDDRINGWDIIRFLKRPVSICKYCNPKIENVDWETGQPKKEDWM